MAKKLPSQTKTDHKKCMVCEYCESACADHYSVTRGDMYMGQKPTALISQYYCNGACLTAHTRQDMSITLNAEIIKLIADEARGKMLYHAFLTKPETIVLNGWASDSFISDISCTKHLRLFYEALLARKSTEELHLLRMKAKKHAGEMLELYMVAHKSSAVDYFSCLLQSELGDDNNAWIMAFARGF